VGTFFHLSFHAARMQGRRKYRPVSRQGRRPKHSNASVAKLLRATRQILVRPSVSPHQDRSGALDEERPQIALASLFPRGCAANIGEPHLDRSHDRVAGLDAMIIELVGHARRIQREDGVQDAFVFLHRFINAPG
jgi:hypothetical protein